MTRRTNASASSREWLCWLAGASAHAALLLPSLDSIGASSMTRLKGVVWPFSASHSRQAPTIRPPLQLHFFGFRRQFGLAPDGRPKMGEAKLDGVKPRGS